MAWYKLIFDETSLSAGDAMEFQEEFQLKREGVDDPVAFALFKSSSKPYLPVIYYLPPLTRHFVEDLMVKYGAEAVNEPDAGSVELLIGEPESMDYWFSEK